MGKKRWMIVAAASALLVLIAPALAAFPDEGNACQIIRQEVDRSYAAGGACPCPYHAASNGRLCGGRSAWAKRQGVSPRCFIGDGETASRSVVTVAQHARWPEAPACGVEICNAAYSASNRRDADRRSSQFRVNQIATVWLSITTTFSALRVSAALVKLNEPVITT